VRKFCGGWHIALSCRRQAWLFGSDGLGRVTAIYEHRLQGWKDWNHLAQLAQGSPPTHRAVLDRSTSRRCRYFFLPLVGAVVVSVLEPELDEDALVVDARAPVIR
jgi:hypothetical protein